MRGSLYTRRLKRQYDDIIITYFADDYFFFFCHT